MLDREGVQRILAAVNLPLVPVSDPDKLLADLEGWQSIYRTGEVQRGRPADREELARRIIRAGEHFNELLDKYIYAYDALYLRRHRLKLDSLRIKELPAPTDRLGLLDDSPGLNKLIGFKQQASLSNFENAVGGLHHIFVRHFGVDRRYTVDPYAGGTITGPFIAFAEAVLKEAGLRRRNYSGRYIANALVKLSKLKS